MAETLGSLCDKLTIVKLKQFHSEDKDQLSSLDKQALQLQDEMNEYINGAIGGKIPAEKLTFAANKVYKKESNQLAEITGNIGQVISQLAAINCELWHVQEKVYFFEEIPGDKKDGVVKELAILNLDRNNCIDKINGLLAGMVIKK